ncbi:hypothetical protein ACU4GD_34005 [Cupriavidus basilensis]
MGRTTLLSITVLGICPPTGGEIRFRDVRIDTLPSHRIAHQGIGLVPEGRRIFSNLSVREYLARRPLAMASGRTPGRSNECWDSSLGLKNACPTTGNLLSGERATDVGNRSRARGQSHTIDSR